MSELSELVDSPGLTALDKVQVIAFSRFLSLAGSPERPMKIDDVGLYDWALGRTAYCNITAWTLPG